MPFLIFHNLFNPRGEMCDYLPLLFRLKWLSVTKLKARSEALRRTSKFESSAILSEIKVNNKLGNKLARVDSEILEQIF